MSIADQSYDGSMRVRGLGAAPDSALCGEAEFEVFQTSIGHTSSHPQSESIIVSSLGSLYQPVHTRGSSSAVVSLIVLKVQSSCQRVSPFGS